MTLLTKRDVLRLQKEYGFAFHKRFGQNFLIDGNISRKIIDSLPLTKRDIVVEIGPGLGQMTLALARRAKRVIAVEIDRAFFRALCDRAGDAGNITPVNADFLKYDLSRADVTGRYKVISNLPYSISSPVIARLIEDRRNVECAVLMLQKEVAARMAASPGTPDYGALSIFVQLFCETEMLFLVKRRCFYPMPKVDSAVISLKMRRAPAVALKDEALFFSVVGAAFSKRRKTLINALGSSSGLAFDKQAIFKALHSCDIDPVRRGETLSISEFARLSNILPLS